jgi:aspartate/methionine/tyrosine aminotransferase
MQRFSHRSGLVAEPNALSAAFEARRREGRLILDLTSSNPTRAGLPYEGATILSGLADERALTYDPHPFGMESARSVISSELRSRGLDASTDRIVLTASTSEAYGFAFKLLCDPGDEVLVPAPSYPLLEHLAGLESVRIRPYRLAYDGAWHVDLESVKAAVTERTRAIVCVNPNNPTGSFLSRAELTSLAELGLPILSDEVFSAYAWKEDPRRARSALEIEDGLVIAFDGLSKFGALPQLKLAWMVLGGSAPLVADARSRLELIADSYLSVNTPVQVALPAILRSAERTRNAIVARTLENRRRIQERTSGSPVTPLHADGGWYAVLRLPRTLSEDEWVLGLLERGVWVQPGYFYDFDDEAFVVVSLLTPEDELDAGLVELVSFVAARV